MLEIILILTLIIGVFVGIGLLKQLNRKPKSQRTPIRAKKFISNHEITMFGEISQAVPECHIFVQVAFSALLKTSSLATRNMYNRLVTDFVITDQYFNVIAVIELDDKSHDNKQEKDAQRDAMMQEAGYKILRYRHMPSKEKLRADILG